MTFGDGFDDLADQADDLSSDIRQMDDEMVEALDRAVAETSRRIKLAMEGFVPIDEGDLLRSISQPVKTAEMERTITVDEPYARAIEYGRGKVTINAKPGSALRFKIDGQVIYAGKVEQEPTAGTPFVRPAVRGNQRRLQREIRDELRRAFRRSIG